MIENLYSLREAAKRTGMSIPTMHRRIVAGTVKAYKILDSQTASPLRYAIPESEITKYNLEHPKTGLYRNYKA